MNKKYTIRLSDAERVEVSGVVEKLKGSSQKVRRAQILLKADANGPGWPDVRIAEAFSCRVQTIENLRKRLVTEGFEIAFHGQPCSTAPRQKVLDGKQEAKVIALRLGKPPTGFANWSLRLLAEHVVELGIVDSISHETEPFAKRSKKRHDQSQNPVLGDSARLRRGVRSVNGRSPGHL